MNGTFMRAPRGVALAVGITLLVALALVELGGLDRDLFYRLNRLAETQPTLWAHITILSDGLVCLILLLPWIRTHPERVWAGFLGALLMVAVLAPFKLFLSLPRPEQLLDPDTIVLLTREHRLRSFPSGHAATILLYAGVWGLSVRRRLPTILVLVPAAVIALSRVVVGVHWPSDVLAGAAVGWLAAWVGLRWAYRFRGLMVALHRFMTLALLACAATLLVIDHTGYPGVVWFQRGVALTCLAWGLLELRSDRPSDLLANPTPGRPH